ncbi:hypothetical protein [Cytophaga hutchinsonii]|uniref:Uncharacterized protein n=1 Tax=Cytophaga hutchinsonii (strain ATCC 33406 / DSM 1761 / CIP 103989 / NBRC 15051 / NCIMB 9469 / D465) TaxID=269798 RepID=A0A6N4SN83_CYTH3|nr:hypothetical protein [Cytophaga hutchinsonii]ABG57734.1 conserved hypothetical protein [Cytophaga hutchinsonii ATCC 33406]SFX04146.1 hypothetical protein SAMN04487930_101290 [Cytophaga hutchinsonii ATCC 33406]
MIKYFLLWFPMFFIAILNGTARDLGYKKYLSEIAARQLSTFTLLILIGMYIFFVIKKYPPASSTKALLLGLFWMLLTLDFEFGFGLYRGNTWIQLLDDYNMFRGHLWLLVPVWLTLAPYIFFKMGKRNRKTGAKCKIISVIR